MNMYQIHGVCIPECDCASNQLCVNLHDDYENGTCICDDEHVADGSGCVRCNPARSKFIRISCLCYEYPLEPRL